MMVDQIVNFLSRAVFYATSLATHLFNATGTWSLVLGGISIVVITRFILGPILGIDSVASDLASGAKKGYHKGYEKETKKGTNNASKKGSKKGS